MAEVLQAEGRPLQDPRKLPAAAVLTALGVVYGDIGTSTLYGLKQAVEAGMGIAFLSAHTIGRDLFAGNLVILDVQGFPALLNWYLVHNRTKRLPPVAAAFKEFLLREGAALIERLVRFEPRAAAPARRAKAGNRRGRPQARQ